MVYQCYRDNFKACNSTATLAAKLCAMTQSLVGVTLRVSLLSWPYQSSVASLRVRPQCFRVTSQQLVKRIGKNDKQTNAEQQSTHASGPKGKGEPYSCCSCCYVVDAFAQGLHHTAYQAVMAVSVDNDSNTHLTGCSGCYLYVNAYLDSSLQALNTVCK